MAQRLPVLFDKKPCYDIVYSNSFDELLDELNSFDIANRKVCIYTDSNVEKLYAKELQGILEGHCRKVTVFSFPAGEAYKNLNSIQLAYTHLIETGFDRRDLIVALGGGVVGDMAGFTAATYLRGIDFIQIPTTLLAQCDSSIGGKTGVDLDGYKNMVGAFYMPKLVYMNLSTLKSLDDKQYFNGFAEVMKYGLIKDAMFYEWLIDKMYEIRDRDLDTLEEMIIRSNTIKKLVVEKDPTEKGDRALLNFGHTIGHAIEKYMNFTMLHGECVALGCVAAAFISWKHELLTMEEYYEIRDMFVPFCLPISLDNLDEEEVLRLTKSDKKMKDGQIQFILLKRVGKAMKDTSVSDADILAALSELNFKEED